MRAVAPQPTAVEAARQADREAVRAVREFRCQGRHEEASERYGQIVERHQRRASRIAFHYLRDAADADDAVQDAFLRAFVHLETYRDELPFEVWFTRILVNGCLDRIKSRNRRNRWVTSAQPVAPGAPGVLEAIDAAPDPEAQAMAAERGRRLREALATLPDRQRTVFMLSQELGYTSREVGQMTGMKETTVRVHLFRAIRKLRTALQSTTNDV